MDVKYERDPMNILIDTLMDIIVVTLIILFLISAFFAIYYGDKTYFLIALGLAIILVITMSVSSYMRQFNNNRGLCSMTAERQEKIAMLVAEIKQKLEELEALLEEASEEE